MYLTLSFLSLIETISPQDTWSPYRVSFKLLRGDGSGNKTIEALQQDRM